MPAFEYQALTAAGRTEKGVLQADTARAARGILRERGLNPLGVAEIAEHALGRRLFSGRSRLNGVQMALLTRQLSTLITAGLPIDEALDALAEGSEGKLRSQVVSLRARVMEGASLAAALAEFPATFPPLFRASVAAGEQAGKLDLVLRRLADHAEASAALRQRVIAALAYPLLLTLVAISVVTALMIYVVPSVIGVFAQFHAGLPWPTRLLIALSKQVHAHGAWLLLVLPLLALGAGTMGRQPQLRARWQTFLLRTPLLGRLLRSLDAARFTQTLALLTASAVPLLDALAIAGQVIERIPLRHSLAQVAARVREGVGFAQALGETGQFPRVVVRLIASGERAGRLDAMLAEASEQQQRELDTALSVVTAVLGPGVILLVGALVLFIVLAILLPIFQINTLVR